jgi:nucleosome assembly protein 1-like 1
MPDSDDSEHDEHDNLLDDVSENDSDDDDDDIDLPADSPLAALPPAIVARVARLQTLDEEREAVLKDYLQERAALELKYSARTQPLYERRARIVAGTEDKSIAEEAAASVDDAGVGEVDMDTMVAGVPQFWVCAMTQMETIGEMITEEDVDCLEHLRDISCTDDADGQGFTLRFTFGPNDYFHDSVLTKRYAVPNLLQLSDEPILKAVEGCSIQWKDGASLVATIVKKKQRGKGKHAGQVRTITKTEPKESFFQWFDPPTLPSMDDLDEAEAEALEEVFDADYEVAVALRTQLVPRAVLWFTGEAAESEMLEAMNEAVAGASGDDDG